MSNIDVVITGLGATTPLGGDVTSTWDGLLAGRSGIRTIEADWVEELQLPVKIGGMLAVDPAEVLPRVQARRLDRCEQVALIAARQAWADAGFTEPTDDHTDVDVAGGAEACIHPITLAGFAQARTVSTRNDDPGAASRPFDANRDGFVLGEGSGVVILERADLAKARGARVYATIAGHGITSDAYHITGNHPEGIGQIAAMRAAMKMAGVTPADVGHVNAHATSTVVGDIGEAAAIRNAVGDHPVVTAPKGALGHLVGGAGAVEGIITILSLYHGIVPATLNLTDLDPRVQLDVVSGEARKVELTAAISNSFGFGGHNTALLFTPAA
jgi:3-oxoacyl-(acyl-carrier-protein) synthase